MLPSFPTVVNMGAGLFVTLPCVWAICPHETTPGHRIYNKVSRANTALMRVSGT